VATSKYLLLQLYDLKKPRIFGVQNQILQDNGMNSLNPIKSGMSQENHGKEDPQ
jgi:hypothetical protein